ncbi:DUF2298 domain-containing protein [Andreprevotia chitinilytica]|uniref:DUF2298 domain-containing protein n=1 Tax=Andreprevotia chitinilytica TaxID=396808 RepID=UPI0005532A19|nr:DUF2298 domain-containing protein [Andreprevotia chitinilytica]
MNAIYLALTVAILLVNLGGLACLFTRWLPDRNIARAGGLLAICLVLFFVEHFIGLGKLGFLWPITTIAAVALIGKRLCSKDWLDGELPFVVPFLFALIWRLAYPDIDAATEHLTDLYFINNYIGGDTLPPADRWLPGYVFNFYYGFLHYSVALLGRWLGVSAGVAMNLGGAVVFGLLGSLGWSVASRFVTKLPVKVLIVVALICGGTGVAPLLTMLFPGNAEIQMWGNTRFAGRFDQDITSEFGKQLFPKLTPETAPVPGFEPRDLPLETPSYLLFLGDVHPPIGGFALLFFALALMARLEKPEEGDDARPLAFALGATMPLPLALNTWVFPLQVLLVAGWFVYRWRGKLAHYLPWLMAGAIAASLLLYPFLSNFVPNALSTPLGWTETFDHTPLRQGLAIWWPILWLVVLALLQGPKNRLAWWSAFGVVAMWLMTEFITVHDPHSGAYERFNTVLKWWSWLYPFALVWLTALNASARQKWLRAAALVPVFAVSLYLLPQANFWMSSQRPHAGRIQGDGWLRDDDANRAILTWLRAAPQGLTLESVERGSYSQTSGFAMHAGQPSAIGWPDHVNEWRANPGFVGQRADAVRSLYQGQLPDAKDWLKNQRIQYMVWSRFDSAHGPVLAQLKTQLAPDYVWMPLWANGDEQYGVFKRLYR